MKHPAFKALSRTVNRVFRERGQHYWHRYDADDAVPISLVFNDAYSEVSTDGIKIDEGQPTAFILVEEALKVAPERSQVDVSMLFNNSDHLVINGIRYGVESCKFDGYHSCEVRLVRKKQ